MNRRDDARFDAVIHDHMLRELGVVEEDQPTEVSHMQWMNKYRQRYGREFTTDERIQIRMLLGLGEARDD